MNTKADMLLDIQEVAQAEGGAVSASNYEAVGQYSLRAIRAMFGTWKAALDAAGLKVAVGSFGARYCLEDQRPTILRTCLRCDRCFPSVSPANRICPGCANAVEQQVDVSGYDEQTILLRRRR